MTKNQTTYRAICLDLDGTVYKGIKPIQEAVSFIEMIQESGVNPYFVTNNSSATQESVQQKLANFGVSTTTENIMTSAIASAKYCQENYAGATVQMIGGKGLLHALQQENIQVVEKNADIVMIGIDREVTYEKLAQACLAVRNGAIFIGTNGDRAIPTERGFEPGNGSLVKLVEYSTGMTPILIGKPEPYMLQVILAEHGYSKDEMVMVGDNYDTDIQAGIKFGIDTIHVNSGITSTKDVLGKSALPTYTIESLTEWQTHFERMVEMNEL